MQERLKRRFLPFLIHHIGEYFHYYFAAITSLVLLHYIQSLLPGLGKELGELGAQNRLAEVSILPYILLALGIVVFRTLSRYLFFYPARIQQKNLRMELMSKLESSHPNRFESYNDGQLYEILFNDLNRIRGFVGFALLQFANIIIALFIFIPKLFEVQSELLITFIPLLIGTVINAISISVTQPWARREVEMAGELQNFIIESYHAKKTIKNYHSEKSFIDVFQIKSENQLKVFKDVGIVRAFFSPIVRLSFGFSLLWGAFIINRDNLGAGVLIFYSGFLFLLLEPLQFIAWIGMIFSQGMTGWRRIKDLLKTLDVESEFEKNVEFKNGIVQFKLWDKKQQLPLDQSLILVGETGSGKSYALKAIATALHQAQQNYALVTQEPFLYNDTIYKNIFLGKEPSPEELQKAENLIKLFVLDNLANSVKDVLHLEVGENGKKVSGGQAKRIALIRSLLSDPDYILWDDPFSSVDVILESSIFEELKKQGYLKNKKLILTSHRLTTVKQMDSLAFIELKMGITEIIKVKDLKNNKKVYEFFEKQMV